MALRVAASFDQLPTTPVNISPPITAASNPGNRLRGTPFYIYSNHTGQLQLRLPQVWADADGYLVYRRGYGNYTDSGIGPGTNRMALYVPLKEQLANLSASSKFTFGFRYRAKEVGYSTGFAILTSFDLTQRIVLMTAADLPAYADEKVYYVEFEVDLAAALVKRWVDGQVLSSVTLTAALVTALASNGLLSLTNFDPTSYQANNVSGAVSATWANGLWQGFRDFYLIEDTKDDTLNRRLGPQLVKPLVPASAEINDWTAVPTDKSVVDVLKTPYTTASLFGDQVDYALSGPSQAPLNLKFAAPTVGGKINAVMLRAATYRPSGSSGNLTARVQLGQAKTDDKVVPVTSTANYYQPLGVFEKAPDGSAWSADKVNATVLSLTPTAVT